MDRFSSKEDQEETPLTIAKDIIYSDSTLPGRVRQIEQELKEAYKRGWEDGYDECKSEK